MSSRGGGSPAREGHGRDRGRRELGHSGEHLAAGHLESLGFRLLAHNVRTRYGEIDLIAFDGLTLAFVEVKTRRAHAPLRADDAQPVSGLARRQRARLRRLAAAWLRQTVGERPFARVIRFDAIGVIVGAHGELLRLEHIEGGW
jgi:putative endonuclease